MSIQLNHNTMPTKSNFSTSRAPAPLAPLEIAVVGKGLLSDVVDDAAEDEIELAKVEAKLELLVGISVA